MCDYCPEIELGASHEECLTLPFLGKCLFFFNHKPSVDRTISVGCLEEMLVKRILLKEPIRKTLVASLFSSLEHKSGLWLFRELIDKPSASE